MARIIKQRMTARLDGEFVLFLIGMRINRFWKVHKWLPVAMAMPRMLAELARKPESGFLGAQSYGGIPPVMAQYWRSFAHLEAYAKDPAAEHFPAWKAFNRRVRSNGDVDLARDLPGAGWATTRPSTTTCRRMVSDASGNFCPRSVTSSLPVPALPREERQPEALRLALEAGKARREGKTRIEDLRRSFA